MSALFFIVAFGYLVFYHITRDNISPTVGGVLYVVMMLTLGIGWAWQIFRDYRERQSINRDAFVREVVRQHQRANEARQTTERA